MANPEESIKVELVKSSESYNESDVIKISLGHQGLRTLKISFQRTVRIAGSEDASSLPPPMVEKGGFFMAMYRTSSVRCPW